MRPYIIRKCPRCKLWHLVSMNMIGDTITPIIIYSFLKWWDEGIIIINFPSMIMSVD